MIKSISPPTEKEIVSVHAASAGDVDAAVKAARKALKDPAWADIEESSGDVRSHPVAWLDHAAVKVSV